jgi:hypothetical protein
MSIVLDGTNGITTPDVDSDGLTVDTNTLFVDAANNRVGIGTNSPNVKAEVSGADAAVSLRVNTENVGVSANNFSQIQLSDVGTVRSYWRSVRDGSGATQFAYNDHLAFLSDGGGTPTERARIDASGNLHVGRTTSSGTGVTLNPTGLVAADSPTNNSIFVQRETGGGGSCVDLFRPITTNNPHFMYFGTEATFTTRGSIFYNRGTGLVVYNTTSDKRLKENIVDASAASALVSDIKVRSFDWKNSESHLDFGFVAQELYEVAPFAVTAGSADDEEIGKAPWSVDSSALVPLLTKALQEALTKIEALEARVAALETNA